MSQRILRVLMVAPSRYDAHGVMIYRVGIVQNGSLAALGGLIEDWNARRAATDRAIRYEVFDEKVREPVTDALLSARREAALAQGERFVLMICGVQTATWPRARDIALIAKRAGVDVIAGGVHLSTHGPSLEFLASCGVAVGVGEAEMVWDRIVEDCFEGRLAGVYKQAPDEGLDAKSGIGDIAVPDLTRAPFPHVPREAMRRYVNRNHYFVDASRGCPFVCTFCVVKNAFGRTMRSRDPVALLAWMKHKVDHEGARYFGFVDDNFVRSPRHLELLEGIGRLRAEGREFNIAVMLDVEATCYAGEDSPRGERSRRFLEACRAAGTTSVYIGLESTNDAALVEMKKQVNRARRTTPESARREIVAKYRAAVGAWQRIGAWVDCGYILGLDADTPGYGDRAARDMLEIGIDVVSFYQIAPLPGAEDYARAKSGGLLLTEDFNEYFKNGPMRRHPTIDPAGQAREHAQAVRRFFAWRHVLRRTICGMLGIGRAPIAAPWVHAKRQIGFKLMILSGLNSYYEGGLFRRRGLRWRQPREVVTDEEARRHYLGIAKPERPVLPPGLADDGSMESLPILRRHRLGV